MERRIADRLTAGWGEMDFRELIRPTLKCCHPCPQELGAQNFLPLSLSALDVSSSLSKVSPHDLPHVDEDLTDSSLFPPSPKHCKPPS